MARKIKRKGTKLSRGAARAVRYTTADRAAVLLELEEIAANPEAAELVEPLVEAYYDGVGEALGDAAYRAYEEAVSHLGFLFWMCFDARLEPAPPLADVMLREPRRPAGQKAFLRAMRATRMRLYEITRVAPGFTITVRDALDGGEEVTLRERSGSRTLQPGALIATRVMRPGASGEPEADGGFFNYSELQREPVLAGARQLLADLREEGLDEDFCWREEMPLLFHLEWRTSRLPTPVNYDGDALTRTRVTFEVRDRGALEAALDAAPAMERASEGEACWVWSGTGTEEKELVVLGRVTLDAEGRAVLEANSVPRGERGRALLESLAGEAIAHRSTVHEDVMRKVLEQMREGARPDDPLAGLDATTREALHEEAEQFLARHQRAWLDEAIPALDGASPREAAKDAALRPRLVELLALGDRLYQRALATGAPAADPRWVREELGVFDGCLRRDPSQLPALAHERMAELAPELAALARDIAARVRAEPGYDAMRTVSRRELEHDLGFVRFLRTHTRDEVEAHADPATASSETELLATHLEVATNLELHHRKVFWVGESVSWMLGATRLDVEGDLLRLPFGSFAIAFTDRYALGLAERALAREPACRLRGHLLEVVTAYVTAREGGLRIAFACDALDPGWPYLLVRELRYGPEDRLDRIVDSHLPGGADLDEVPSMFRSFALRDLVRLVVNAILYATSADAEVREVAPPREGGKHAERDEAIPPLSGETVFHLPGKIEIGALRALQAVRRGELERTQVQRCMVRGHWRRAARQYRDQRPRWVSPHWRGPSIAAIVERQYRLVAPEPAPES
ncbi:MAG: hypothetical protein KF729_31055 [Sandaracinaceae bacterium]|nr:hypothetical protein [Sandaracinaceae bacterium]